ncbi:MAG TPA: helix-turn-helix domain-containing protein [Bacillota bacterium]|nr:helix-turn-helix domain-containing protein [Bacillota bacterium]
MATANKEHTNEHKTGNPPQTRGEERNEPTTLLGVAHASSKLKIPDLIEMLQLSASMVYKMVERNEIPHYRIGTAIRFDRAEIREWLKQYHRPAKSASIASAEKVLSCESTEPRA